MSREQYEEFKHKLQKKVYGSKIGRRIVRKMISMEESSQRNAPKGKAIIKKKVKEGLLKFVVGGRKKK